MEIKICQISVKDLIEGLAEGWADWVDSVSLLQCARLKERPTLLLMYL